MAAEHEPSLELEQQVLADSFDALEPATGQAIREPERLRARMRRLDLDPFADERLQPPGRAVKAVALRHVRRVAASCGCLE
jgi:hypothetical protein